MNTVCLEHYVFCVIGKVKYGIMLVNGGGGVYGNEGWNISDQ